MTSTRVTSTEIHNGSAGPTLATPHRVQRVDSAVLLGSSREIVIVHQQEEYRLRITKNGKLILTK